MLKIILCLVMACMLGISGMSQSNIKVSSRCAYGEGNLADEKCLQSQAAYVSPPKTSEAVKRILAYSVGNQIEFVLKPCSGIDNAEAIIDEKGYRIILYDPAFLDRLNTSTNSDWPRWSILAHEIAHHLYQHLLTNANLERKRADELAADYYSGLTLCRLRASLQQAQAFIKGLADVDDEAHSSHPKNDRRLKAVEEGFEECLKQNTAQYTPSTTETHTDRVDRGNEHHLSKARTVTIDNTGYISGLNGRLNPILDSLDRKYLYADNIAIEGGKNQPVSFSLNQPFLVEDNTGNRFELTVLAITKKSTVIQYKQLSSGADQLRANLNVKVIDQTSQPIRGAQLLAIFSDGTYLQGTTNSKGEAQIANLKNRMVTIYCAHQNYSAYYKENHDSNSDIIIPLKSMPGKGSIIINTTGYISGLDGRLSPILDTENRMYLYADNISIENGRNQPVYFRLSEPFQVEDSKGKRFELNIIAIIARSTLIEYTQLN